MQKTSLFEFLTEAIPSFYKYSERREQRQEEIPFPTWLYRAASYIRGYKYKKVMYTTNDTPHFFR